MLLLGLATWMGTSVIVEAEIFRDVREACDRLHVRVNNWGTYKLRYLIQCHMCTGIWVAAIIAIFVPPIVSSGLIGWGVTALAIKGIAHAFLVLQKLGEALTDQAKSDAEWNVAASQPKTELLVSATGYADQHNKTPLRLSDCPNYSEESK